MFFSDLSPTPIVIKDIFALNLFINLLDSTFLNLQGSTIKYQIVGIKQDGSAGPTSRTFSFNRQVVSPLSPKQNRNNVGLFNLACGLNSELEFNCGWSVVGVVRIKVINVRVKCQRKDNKRGPPKIRRTFIRGTRDAPNPTFALVPNVQLNSNCKVEIRPRYYVEYTTEVQLGPKYRMNTQT